MGETISNTKAENLFWLGRYTQRIYIILHFLRKYRDMMIDEDENAYSLFCDKLGVENKYTCCAGFLHDYLFDKSDRYSLISGLSYANNNAALLREEIKSETLAYLQMSICHMEKCAEDSDLDELQMVTDSILAFWGSIDERIPDRDTRNMIKAGKYLETFDLHIRFDYPREKIIYLLDRLEKHIEKEKFIFDQDLFLELKQEVEQPVYDKLKVLYLLSQLFII